MKHVRKQHILISMGCLMGLVVFVNSDSVHLTDPPPRQIVGGRFHVGFMYWCERPIFQKDWYLIVAAELEKVTELPGGNAHPDPFIQGTFRVHEVLQARPTRHTIFTNASYLVTEGCGGLHLGDKVLLFIDEYDGGYGLVPVAGSNCRVGIQIESFDAPIIAALKRWLRHEGNLREQVKLLLDHQYAAIWQQYGYMGIDYWLEMHQWFAEHEAGEPSVACPDEQR